MSKVIFFGLPTQGHTNPSLALVKELVDRGEEIIYYSSRSFEAQIEETGALYRPYRVAFLENFVIKHMWSNAMMKAMQDILVGELERIRGDNPSYIIYDSYAFWGRALGDALGIPSISSITTFALRGHIMAAANIEDSLTRTVWDLFAQNQALAEATEIREQIEQVYGIRGPRMEDLLFGHYGKLNIVYTSRLFQPAAETFEDSFKFIGPAVNVRRDQIDFPWDQLTHNVIIYVSLGTSFNQDEAFFRTCFEALSVIDCQVVVSAGNDSPADTAISRKAPPNFIVRAFVPQLAILQRASLFVTRGGMNSVSESLYYGVPVVVVPYLGEQFLVASRAQELGAGILIKREEVTSSTLRDAVLHILSNKHYTRNVEMIGDSFRRSGGVREAVDHIFSHIQAQQ